MIHANIDADIFTYSFGSCTDDFGRPLAWPLVATRLNAQIKNIQISTGATSYQLYLTGDGNFRNQVATIRHYKGTRPVDKPYWYEQLRRYLINFRNAQLIEGWEADDQLAMDQREDTILCSLDKDLDMVPGAHYNWTKDKYYHISALDGIQNFYCQLLTGDRVDNIPGLHGVGKSSTYLKRIRELDSEPDMLSVVLEEYDKRFGRYAWPFLEENAQLLWMVRHERPDPENEVVERLRALQPLLTGAIWKRTLLKSLSGIK